MLLHHVVQYIEDQGVIAIVRTQSADDDLAGIVQAVAEGGVRCIELTMTTPGALASLERATQALEGEEVMLGVGSVLDAETCRMAILAGAKYIVSPVVSEEVIRMSRRYGRPTLCGAYTPTEVLRAWELGSDIVKVFPAEFAGPAHLKALRGPLPQIPLLPTGGVRADNVHEFFAAGAVAVGVGGNLVSKDLVAAKDFAGMTRNARAFADAVAAARA